MKKFLKEALFILTAYCLVMFIFTVNGCGSSQIEPQNEYARITGNSPETYTWEVKIYDSCEYVTGYHSIAHKGNCKNHAK